MKIEDEKLSEEEFIEEDNKDEEESPIKKGGSRRVATYPIDFTIDSINNQIEADNILLVWCRINPLTFDSALSCHCERPKGAWQSRFLGRDCFVVNTPRNDSPNVKIC